MKKYILAIIILSVIAILPFFKSGFFKSHDGEWMIIRFSAFHQTLRSGQFPVRFVDRLNNNYGYPVLNFLYPLPFYLAEAPKLLGFGFTESIKITFMLSVVLSSLFMFLALLQKYDKTASFTGAIVYLFLPYRFVDLYVRGSLGECVAFAIVPICLLAIFKIEKNEKKYLPILSLSIAFLIIAHNVIAFLFLPFFILLIFALVKKTAYSFISIALGVLISTFFWLPALFDLQFVKFSQIKVANVFDHLVGLSNLIVPAWGYGSSPTTINPLPVQLGVIGILSVLVSISLQFLSKSKSRFVILLSAIYVLAMFLMSRYSTFFWKLVPGADIIQFPWRLLSLEVFISAILSAYLVSIAKKKIVACLVIVISSLILTIGYIKPVSFVNYPDGYYSTNEDTTTVKDEYLPKWIESKKDTRADQKIETNNTVRLVDSKILPANYAVHLISDTDTTVQINSIYFPGWKVTVNGAEVPISFDNQFGLINFPLPKGEHEVIIKYSRTPIHAASEIISLSALIITALYAFKLWQKRNS